MTHEHVLGKGIVKYSEACAKYGGLVPGHIPCHADAPRGIGGKPEPVIIVQGPVVGAGRARTPSETVIKEIEVIACV